MKFRINYGHVESSITSGYPPAPLQLIPNPDGVQPVEWCQTCGRESMTLLWTGFQTVCVECDKNRTLHRKLQVPMLDNGITLNEFYYRLVNREILFKWISL